MYVNTFCGNDKKKTKKKSVAANATGAKYSTSQMCFGNAVYANNFPLLKNGKNGPSSRLQ